MSGLFILLAMVAWVLSALLFITYRNSFNPRLRDQIRKDMEKNGASYTDEQFDKEYKGAQRAYIMLGLVGAMLGVVFIVCSYLAY